MFELMLIPFLACLILTGIHVYLGFHVIERGVIFLDLALAQMAALGGIFGLVLGLDHLGVPTYIISLAFTFLGAALFSNIDLSPMGTPDAPSAPPLRGAMLKKSKISKEAFIGICYVVASAVAILLLSKSTVEAEMLKDMLVGNILTVSKSEVILTAIWYAFLGGILWLFREKFLQVTRSYHEKNVPHSKFWDFCFYALFGTVVTSSVSIAGVFLVFSFLIIPSVCALILGNTMRNRIQIGWGIGVLASLLGIVASVLWDLPTGAAIVAAFGLVLTTVLLMKQLTR